MEPVEGLIKVSAAALEAAGIVIIGLGAVVATISGVWKYLRKKTDIDLYTTYRRQLSRAILLGLEFLVAADIIRTVAIEPTFASVGILGAIVLIRTFLSFTLEVEVTGRWPWSHNQKGDGSTKSLQG